MKARSHAGSQVCMSRLREQRVLLNWMGRRSSRAWPLIVTFGEACRNAQCLMQWAWDWHVSATSQAMLSCRSGDHTVRTVAREGQMAFRWAGRDAVGLTAPRLGGIGKSVGRTNESFLVSEGTSLPCGEPALHSVTLDRPCSLSSETGITSSWPRNKERDCA